MEKDIQWMARALQLAAFGRGQVSPNPMVGCVIVCDDRIIGEGWHRHYGEGHAEVRAVEDAEQKGNGHLLSQATVYVTLEPCSHTGKTPPCADLLVRKAVKEVVICNVDPNPLVSGRGISKLQQAGIEVRTDILEQEGLDLNKRFFTAMKAKRPYVILKWAESADGMIGGRHGNPVPISGTMSNTLVHQWRSEEDSILVGYKTAAADNPKLNVRHWAGYDPVRIVIDKYLKLPENLHLFDQSQPTVVVNYEKSVEKTADVERYASEKQIGYVQISQGPGEIEALLSALFERKIHSVFVEGGTKTIEAFIQSGLWDEIRRCQGSVIIGDGVAAPVPKGILRHSHKLENDLWTYYSRI